MNNPRKSINRQRVFIDISIDNKKIGRMIFELFDDVVPRTTKNFIELIKHKYSDTKFHRIIPEFVIQGGDFTRGDGTGGYSIYGDNFEDECFDIKHDQPGLLSMANSGPNTNGSQFFITLNILPHLDDKHVVFGKIIKGHEILNTIEKCGTEDGTPRNDVCIIKCGISK